MATRALRVEIARPLNMSWDELGTILRVQRRIIPQLLRAGMDARIACGVVGTPAVKDVVSPAARGASAATVAYQAMKAELERIRASKKWKPETRPALDLCGGMLSALSQIVKTKYPLRSSFKGDQPIPVRKQETAVTEDEKSRPVLTVKLLSTGRAKLALRPSKGSHWSRLKKIASGEYAHGDCRIVRDDARKKWYALIAYEQPERPAVTIDPARALIVHRGVRNALTLVSTTGSLSYVSGHKLNGQLRAIEARMRGARAISAAERGHGSRGRGKKRRYENYEVLAGKRKRLVHTWCQQMAAHVCKLAARHGCGLIVIEDYGGIDPHDDVNVRRALVRFPLYQLKTAIAQRVQLDGLTLVEVCSEYISTSCPGCNNADGRQHNIRTGTFHCIACKLERPADFVAALNMMSRAGVDTSVWDKRMKDAARLVALAKEIA